MVDVVFDPKFKRDFKKIKNKLLKEKVIKQISKIEDDPELGKPMRYGRKGSRELYISPLRLSYKIEEGTIFILALYRKDYQ